MTYFTDRIFYLDRSDKLAHIRYVAPQYWTLEIMEHRNPVWQTALHGDSYRILYSIIADSSPVLLLQEEW